jgi:N-acetylglucosaminyl-diphospho-decaprenol L-rhamnosyltransferase
MPVGDLFISQAGSSKTFASSGGAYFAPLEHELTYLMTLAVSCCVTVIKNTHMGSITVSIVSHAHSALVDRLIKQLMAIRSHKIDKIIVTLNVEDADCTDLEQYVTGLPLEVVVVRNAAPRGFGANHNHAFSLATGEYFCVLNPDIELHAGCDNPFKGLVIALSVPGVGLTYPMQITRGGKLLDFERTLPTLGEIAQRHGPGGYGFDNSNQFQAVTVVATPERVDWACGAFLMLKSSVFKELGGFDERYFMYCEDVDICLRAQLAGYSLARAQSVVVHHTQRRSLKSFRHLSWHVFSLLRLWRSQAYLEYKKQWPVASI